MFTYIYDWLKNLSVYILLITMVVNVLPNEEYKKYIRFFCGLILIMILVMPILQIGNMKSDFEEIFHSIEYKNMLNELEEASRGLEE